MTNYEEEPRGSSGDATTRDESRRERRAVGSSLSGIREHGEVLSSDLAFKLLSSRRRRDLVRCLDDVGGTIDLRGLSELVAAVENDTSPSSLAYDQRKRVYVSLRQTHLPKLSNAGVVDYDPDRSVITPRDGVRALRLLLDTVESAVED